MNTFSLTWLLFRKDLRHQQFAILLLIACSLLLPWYSFLDASPRLEIGMFFARYVYDLILIVIFLRALILDPPNREMHPLTNRPVSWLALFLSKLLFALLAVIYPVILGTYLTIELLGIFTTWREVYCAVIEVAIHTVVLLAFVGFPAFYQKTISGIFLSMGGICIGFFMAFIFVFGLLSSIIQQFFRPDSMYGLTAFIIYIWTFLLAGVIRYRYKSVVIPIVIVLFSLIPAYVIGTLFHLEARAVRKGLDRDAMAAFNRATYVFPDDMDNPVRTVGMGTQVYLSTHIQVGNLPLPYFLNVKAYTQTVSSTATLSSGRSIVSSPIESYVNRNISPEEELAIPATILPKLAGISAAGEDKPGIVDAMFYCCDTSELGPTDDVAASVKGQFYLTEHWVEMPPDTLPIKAGAFLVHNRTRYTIRNISEPSASGEVTFNIVAETVPVLLIAPYDATSQPHVFVFNAQDGRQLTGNFELNENTFSTLSIFQGTFDPNYPFVKLYWVHDLGTKYVPFEFKNVRLREKTMK